MLTHEQRLKWFKEHFENLPDYMYCVHKLALLKNNYMNTAMVVNYMVGTYQTL